MRKNNNNLFDSLVAPISKETQVITRKFSIRPWVKNVKEELSVVEGIREQFIKFRDLENEFVEIAISEIKRNTTANPATCGTKAHRCQSGPTHDPLR